MQDKEQQLVLDVEQQTGSQLGMEYIIVLVYCHPAYLAYVQSTSCEMPDWMNHKLESIAKGNINNLRYANTTTLMAESEEELKNLLVTVEGESEKVGLKLDIQKTKIMAS